MEKFSDLVALFHNVDINTQFFQEHFEMLSEFLMDLKKILASGLGNITLERSPAFTYAVLERLGTILQMYLVEFDIPESDSKQNILRRIRALCSYHILRTRLEHHFKELVSLFQGQDPVPLLKDGEDIEMYKKQMGVVRAKCADFVDDFTEIREDSSLFSLFESESVKLVEFFPSVEDFVFLREEYMRVFKDPKASPERMRITKTIVFAVETMIISLQPKVTDDKFKIDFSQRIRSGKFSYLYRGNLLVDVYDDDGSKVDDIVVDTLPNQAYESFSSPSRIRYLYLIDEVLSTQKRFKARCSLLRCFGFGVVDEFSFGIYESVKCTLDDFIVCKIKQKLGFAQGHKLDKYVLDYALNLGTVLDIFIGVTEGLEFLHRTYSAHQELSAKSVYFVRRQGKLIPRINLETGILHDEDNDEEEKKILTEFAKKELWRTVNYYAPELHKGSRPNRASDMFALGILCYEILNNYRRICSFQIGTNVHKRSIRYVHAYEKSVIRMKQELMKQGKKNDNDALLKMLKAKVMDGVHLDTSIYEQLNEDEKFLNKIRSLVNGCLAHNNYERISSEKMLKKLLHLRKEVMEAAERDQEDEEELAALFRKSNMSPPVFQAPVGPSKGSKKKRALDASPDLAAQKSEMLARENAPTLPVRRPTTTYLANQKISPAPNKSSNSKDSHKQKKSPGSHKSPKSSSSPRSPKSPKSPKTSKSSSRSNRSPKSNRSPRSGKTPRGDKSSGGKLSKLQRSARSPNNQERVQGFVNGLSAAPLIPKRAKRRNRKNGSDAPGGSNNGSQVSEGGSSRRRAKVMEAKLSDTPSNKRSPNSSKSSKTPDIDGDQNDLGKRRQKKKKGALKKAASGGLAMLKKKQRAPLSPNVSQSNESAWASPITPNRKKGPSKLRLLEPFKRRKNDRLNKKDTLFGDTSQVYADLFAAEVLKRSKVVQGSLKKSNIRKPIRRKRSKKQPVSQASEWEEVSEQAE